MNTVVKSKVMQKQWKNYQKDFEYAMDIAFEDACDVVVELMEKLEGKKDYHKFRWSRVQGVLFAGF